MKFKWNEKKPYIFRNKYSMEVERESTAKDIINNTTGQDDVWIDGLSLVEVMRSTLLEVMEKMELVFTDAKFTRLDEDGMHFDDMPTMKKSDTPPNDEELIQDFLDNEYDYLND